MPQWAGLIRNVMVGRQGLTREVLLGLLAEAGGANGRSHLTTGNVTFEAPASELPSLVRRLERGIAGVIGHPEPVILRPVSGLVELLAVETAVGLEPARLEVTFLPGKGPALPASLPLRQGLVLVDVRGRDVVTYCPPGSPARSANRMVERAAGERATSRGWRTVQRLARVGGAA